MDAFDRERYITIYKLLVEILERERPVHPEEHHLSFVLGDLARRIFVDAGFLPPDELLEETALQLRSGDSRQLQALARKLSAHAQHLVDVGESADNSG